jgi:phage tail-like protein
MTAGGASETLHALLSAGGWRGVRLEGLEVRPDGRLELQRVPALAEPALSRPGPTGRSGLALNAACGLYLGDARDRRLIRIALDCPERIVVSASGRPAGLCVGPHGWVFVADRDRRSIRVFTADLEWRDEWGAFVEPVAVAPDGDEAVYVLDLGAHHVLRFDPWGGPDPAANQRLTSSQGPEKPVAIASDEEGTLYVADRSSRAVLRFGPSGQRAGPPLAASITAEAIAVAGGRLYVADRSSGQVLIFRIEDRRSLGSVGGFAGPVSALAADKSGTVYIKTGPGADYLTAEAGAARVANGTLTTIGVLDAGVDSGWTRAEVEAEVPAGTRITLETAEAASEHQAADFLIAAAADTMLRRERYLRMRVSVERDERAAADASPVIAEVRSYAGCETYLDYLPTVYARNASGGGLLTRLLALCQATLGDRELEIEGLHRRFDPLTAPVEDLPRLAGWQAFDVPRGLADADRSRALRDLIAELPELYARRGTPWGVVRFAEIYTGVRPALLEHFRERRLWMLDGSSALGFQTALAGTAAGGIVVDRSQIGTSGPEDADSWGSMLFEETAHRFTAVVMGAEVDEDRVRRLERVLDAEKPAHTAYHLCIAEPRLRVGLQARLGLDSVVAGGPERLALDERGRLDIDARPFDESEGTPGAVGRRGRLGVETVLS